MPQITKSEAHQMGLPKKTIQTVLIPKNVSLANSRKWLKDHGYAWRYHRNTTNFRRFMQTPDIKNASYYTISLPNGIELVYQEY